VEGGWVWWGWGGGGGGGGGGVRMSLIESYSVNCGQAMGALALHGYEHILWVR